MVVKAIVFLHINNNKKTHAKTNLLYTSISITQLFTLIKRYIQIKNN